MGFWSGLAGERVKGGEGVDEEGVFGSDVCVVGEGEFPFPKRIAEGNI